KTRPLAAGGTDSDWLIFHGAPDETRAPRRCRRRHTEMADKKYLKETIRLGDRDLTVETGKVAKQADGSVVIRYGATTLLCAAVAADAPREGIDFFPLTIEYREHDYAAGRVT